MICCYTSEYEYVFDEKANDVVLITHTPPLTVSLNLFKWRYIA